MEHEEVRRAVIETVRRFADPALDAAALHEGAALITDLHVNSVHVVDLVLELEDRFGLRMDDDVIEKMRTIGDIVDYIASRAAPSP